jgi:acetyltransferase EpsM
LNKVSIYGASGHACVVYDILISNELSLGVVVDDDYTFKEIFCGSIVQPPKMDFLKGYPVLIAIGNNDIRKEISENHNIVYAAAQVHHKAFVIKSAELHEGTVLMVQASINAYATIGKHCIVNTGAVVEQHCTLEDLVYVAPNAALAVGVKIGACTHVGTGAAVIENITIGKNCIIGA